MTTYSTITADPPWAEHGGGKCKQGADRHYPLMSLSDIDRTIRLCPEFRSADSAHLYLWVTNNFLPQGLELMRRLGFRYVTNTVWVKIFDVTTVHTPQVFSSLEYSTSLLQNGLGQYQRGAHELLLFGVRGKAMLPATKDRLPSVVFAPRGRHSEKPGVFYQRIERVSPGPYLELFARQPRPGWAVWGNEIST
jgi:N6-adenosine-specific RNA methylase IME4